MPNCYIIAEAGVNHNGKLEYALQLIEAATAAGADAIKFQTFQTESLVTQTAPKAAYQKRFDKDNSQANMLKKLELNLSQFQQIVKHCQTFKIDFLSTPFDLTSLDLLVNQLCVDKIKIGSGELTNSLLLLMTAQTGKPVILSSGMATLGDIEQALATLAFGYNFSGQKPSLAAFMDFYASHEAQVILREKVTLLHCVTDYPAADNSINLNAMNTLSTAFNLPIGYSDHSLGIYIPIAAVAKGATVIEKHLTLDKDLEGPDHKASLIPSEFKLMVDGIHQVEQALGHARKVPTAMEIANRNVARKSLVVQQAIRKGEVFNEKNLTTKRPYGGVSAMLYWDYLGKTASQDYQPDDIICP